jgi:hypothetical protein
MLGRLWGRFVVLYGAENTNEVAENTHEPRLVRSIQITDRIMKMVKERAQRVPVLAFATGRAGLEHEKALADISRSNDIIFMEAMEHALVTAAESGVVTKAADHFHLNETGHRILGETLAKSLMPHLPSRAPIAPDDIGSPRVSDSSIRRPSYFVRTGRLIFGSQSLVNLRVWQAGRVTAYPLKRDEPRKAGNHGMHQ